MLRDLLRTVRDLPLVRWPLIWGYRLALALGAPLDERVYQHIPFRGVVRVATAADAGFSIHSHGGVTENSLYWAGILGHEGGSMCRWLEHARGAGCVLDVGANSGVYALAAAASGAKAVHAFEPIPRIRERLAANAALNGFGQVRIWGECVSDRSGVVTMYDPGGEQPTSASASREFADGHFGGVVAAALEVPAVSIDDFCVRQGIARVDLIKIDVEGFEASVLAGMQGVLARSRPVVLLEVLEPAPAATRTALERVVALGYRVERISEGGMQPDRNLLLTPATGGEGAVPR